MHPEASRRAYLGRVAEDVTARRDGNHEIILPRNLHPVSPASSRRCGERTRIGCSLAYAGGLLATC